MHNQVWCMTGLMKHGMAKCTKQHYKLSGAQYATDRRNGETGTDASFENMMMQCTWWHDMMQHASEWHGNDGEQMGDTWHISLGASQYSLVFLPSFGSVRPTRSIFLSIGRGALWWVRCYGAWSQWQKGNRHACIVVIKDNKMGSISI